jgi:hypothetical protein
LENNLVSPASRRVFGKSPAADPNRDASGSVRLAERDNSSTGMRGDCNMRFTGLTAAFAVVATTLISATIPANAGPNWNGSGFGSGNGYGYGNSYANGYVNASGNSCNDQRGWSNGRGNGYGRRHNQNYASFSGNNFGNLGLGLADRPDVERSARLSNEIQQVQQRLNSGNLSNRQRNSLQNRLSTLQSQQTSLNNLLTSRIGDRRSQIQQLLNSNNLSGSQRSFLQDRLNLLQDQQNTISSNSPGLWNGVKNWFRGY